MCQPTGLFTDLNSERNGFAPQQKKTRSVENLLMSYFQRTRPYYKVESFFTTGRQRTIDCLSLDGFSFHCNTVFQAMGCFYDLRLCHEVRPSLTEGDIQRGSKRELDGLRRHCIQEKSFNIVEICEYE